MEWEQSYNKYCNNVFRYLGFINRYLHLNLNQRLEDSGYPGVKMSFIHVIPFIGKEGTRLTDIAQMHRQSKGAIAKLINEVHQQGYITKQAHDLDSRSKKLFVTERGINLINDANRISAEVNKEIASLLGEQRFQRLIDNVEQLFTAMQLNYPVGQQYTKSSEERHGGRLQIELNEITQAIEILLLEQSAAAGYDDLQKNFNIVLRNIDDQGVRASQIAEVEHTTKQNVSDVAQKLVRKKYLHRIPDPEDRRAQRLVFTKRGKALIIQAMDNLTAQEQRLTALIGKEAFLDLEDSSRRLYQLLNNHGPQSAPADHFSPLSQWLTDMQKNLLLHLQEQHPDSVHKVFTKTGDRLQLRSEFIHYLQSLSIDSH